MEEASRVRKRKASQWQCCTEMPFENIYKALQERGIDATVYNVGLLCRYLETTARDAMNTALADFVQNEIELKGDNDD